MRPCCILGQREARLTAPSLPPSIHEPQAFEYDLFGGVDALSLARSVNLDQLINLGTQAIYLSPLDRSAFLNLIPFTHLSFAHTFLYLYTHHHNHTPTTHRRHSPILGQPRRRHRLQRGAGGGALPAGSRDRALSYPVVGAAAGDQVVI